MKLLLALLLAPAAVAADDAPKTPPAPPWMAPCAADAQRLCAAQKNRYECLSSKLDQTAPACRVELERVSGVLAKMRSGAAAWPAACGEDQKKFCAQGVRRPGPVIECMWRRKKDLSPACRQRVSDTLADLQEFARVLPQAAEAMTACQKDQAAFCVDATPGRGDRDCLLGVYEKLSPRCRAVLRKP
ncbi:MAG: hypothetical protein SF051_16585 [Elusimicrobiota bacterium]|nr:hypothetical protein [Elusimicrobiota bacterium]